MSSSYLDDPMYEANRSLDQIIEGQELLRKEIREAADRIVAALESRQLVWAQLENKDEAQP